MKLTVLPGKPFPLGATWDGKGVNFTLYSEHAKAVELCFFNALTEVEYIKLKITERTDFIWHIYVEGLQPGQLYGYRCYGPYAPEEGHRFNPNKLLLDPYAKAISGTIEWDDALFGYQIGHPDEDLSFSETDSAMFMPKSVVIDPAFNWEGENRPSVSYYNTVIYEAHVKGFTQLHPDIPEHIRGKYAAIAHPVTIAYLKALGISAIELLPVHQFVADRHLKDRGLTNYWGYNTLGYFAPDVRYASGGTHGQQVTEFKEMVKALHQAGIEVILDVVYNHTGEGSHMGPTLSFRGVDNAAYYRLTEDKRYYKDYTGTGNTLNANLPGVLRMLMDSLRYWITEMHVDGFRFDLASTLARELHEVNRLSAFFDIIHQDPVISQVKLIAEPWDVGEGGYQVGKFPIGWAEWNGKYRDCIREYWAGDRTVLNEFADRITGSADLYQSDRKPTSSINFITAHDGFTLNDLVSYQQKHNELNGEDNRDGEDHNRSWNCGTEGPTEAPAVNALRRQQKRNFLATLFLSQGVPMLVAGDEMGRTQRGNNNSYCQDNEISWLDWKNADTELLGFTQKLIHLRQRHAVFSRKHWFRGLATKANGLEDIAWFLPDGNQIEDAHWDSGELKAIAIYLNGQGLHSVDARGKMIVDDDFYLVFNPGDEQLSFKLPVAAYGTGWKVILDTADPQQLKAAAELTAGETVLVEGRSVVVMQCPVDQSTITEHVRLAGTELSDGQYINRPGT